MVLGLAGTLAAPAIVSAQARWKPERPIVICNPFAAGGILDRYVQVPWRKNPAVYRAFAEEYFDSVNPLPFEAGLVEA